MCAAIICHDLASCFGPLRRGSLAQEEGSPDAAVDALRESLEAVPADASADAPASEGGELGAHDVAKGALLYERCVCKTTVRVRCHGTAFNLSGTMLLVDQ